MKRVYTHPDNWQEQARKQALKVTNGLGLVGQWSQQHALALVTRSPST